MSGGGSSVGSHSSNVYRLKRRISGEMTKFVCRSSVVSLTDFTRSLSLVTGNPRFLVTHITISFVSQVLVSQ
jgi:hypothetical protein